MTVTVISSSPGKREEATERLGADEFLVSRDTEQMKVTTRAQIDPATINCCHGG
jgi:D-arabinose 1-dehydrogenase-like Zn-dependent alcohol dehydrogenase